MRLGFTTLQKIGIGLLFTIVGMTTATLMEMRRQKAARARGGTSATTLPINAFYLLPQFLLVGIGDDFMYIGQFDFFVTQSLKGMKAIGTRLFLTTIENMREKYNRQNVFH